MAKSIKDILHSVSDAIVERGEDYYSSGHIESITLSSGGIFAAEVSGSSGDELYEVGGTETALKLIDEFSATFVRRPAMLEELAYLRKKLLKGKDR